MTRRISAAMLAAFAVLPLATTRRAATAQTMNDPNLRAVVVATGLGSGSQANLSTAFVFVNGTTALVANRAAGRVFRVDFVPGGPVAQPGATVLDLDIVAPATNDTQTEYGVQAMALHPNFAQNGWVYLRYDQSPTAGQDTPQSAVTLGPNFSASVPTRNVIERYVWDAGGNGGVGALVFDRVIRTVTVDTRYHHGGPMVFGQDGTLYVTYGNLRREVWVPGHAGPLLSANSAGGLVEDNATIIRINDDGTIPSDNPFVKAPGAPAGTEAWFAYGMRNSFGMDIDPVTGWLWCTDNGESSWDEINRVFAGFNSGSLPIMGPLNAPGQTGTLSQLAMLPGSRYADPVYGWTATIGVTAMMFLNGSGLGASYDNYLIVGAFNNGLLRAFRLDDDRDVFSLPAGATTPEFILGQGFGGAFRGTLAIGMGPYRLPYVLTATGQMIRLQRTDCVGDTNGDRSVDFFDLLTVFSDYGESGPGIPGDVNMDGDVDFLDLNLVLANYGALCPASGR